MNKLILDTTILIAAERSETALGAVIADDDDVAIAAISAAELLVGVELADRRRRRSRANFVEDVLRTVAVEAYELDVARAHAALMVAVRQAGRARGAHDLIIAATALARGRTVVTADESGFEGLPGIDVRLVA